MKYLRVSGNTKLKEEKSKMNFEACINWLFKDNLTDSLSGVNN